MAWIIDVDKIASEEDKRENPDGACNLNAVGLMGPSTISEEAQELLRDKKNGTKFKMYDDDGELYYKGRFILDPKEDEDEEDEFQPLDNFGTPNAGCSHIKYRNPETKTWDVL